MPALQFDSQSMYQGNIKKYEEKLTTPMMKFLDRGMLFVTWYQVNDEKSVYDSGFGQSDELLGRNSGIRYNKIEHLGVSLLNETDVNVGEEVQGILDITQEGSLLIYPNTIVPNPDKDYFIIEHLQMKAVFRCTSVDYDHMRVDGYRKCEYILEGTDEEILHQLEQQTVETYVMKYEDFGTSVSPIIRKDHYEYIKKLQFVYQDLVDMYMGIFYNERHECLCWYNEKINKTVYDECLQHFVSSHSLLSIPESNHLVIFEKKLEDSKFDFIYSRSMWRWIERDCPRHLLEKFPFQLSSAERYIDSSFSDWGHISFRILWPTMGNNILGDGCYIDNRLFNILDGNLKPESSYEKVLQLFVSGNLKSPEQIPLDLYQELLDGCNEFSLFVYTPIIMYIMRIAMKFR